VNLEWPKEGLNRVPYQVFLDPGLYELEQERLYRGPLWSYVALEAEVPNPGDFKTTFIGDTPVVVVRGSDGSLHSFVNRCAHRGAMVCDKVRGNREASFVCPYHQWAYDLAGNLLSVPFRRGIEGKGGYPADFKLAEHSLRKLAVTTYKGLVFASFDDAMDPIEEYIGPELCAELDLVFTRPVEVLGYGRQVIQGNWKFYIENLKDPYHGSLLHLFHGTFGHYRSSQPGGIYVHPKGHHNHIRALVGEDEAREVTAYEQAKVRSYAKGYSLADPSVLRGPREFKYGTSIIFIFPSMVVQQISNTLAIRHVLPKGLGCFELIFTYFGYRDDDAQMRTARLKQANLVGPAGYISMEDGYAIELEQQGVIRDARAAACVELGQRATGAEENLVTEAGIRSFRQYYRSMMGIG
jgi:anthranilate 1,2-dioxygenase large subunit